MKKYFLLSISLILFSLAIFSVNISLNQSVALADTKSVIQGGACDAAGGTCPADPGGTLDNTIRDLVNLLTAAVGVIAVIMIIIGGFRYVTSAGNPESAKTARNTILYAVIGLVIVALAQIIVHFVLNKTTTAISGTTNSSTNPGRPGGGPGERPN